MSCEHCDRAMLYALQALPAGEMTATDAHLSQCADCRRELEALLPVVDSFVAWPKDILRPTTQLWGCLARRLAEETGEHVPAATADDWKEPDWNEAGPGLRYQVLASDALSRRVTILVRLGPGAEYPPHIHAGVEELYLLDGELWIDDRKLHPGDFNRAEPGTGDVRVWSETGCTCVLITSQRDALK